LDVQVVDQASDSLSSRDPLLGSSDHNGDKPSSLDDTEFQAWSSK
jgi:hypothetical protein